MRFIFALVFWFFYVPLIRILDILLYWNPKIRERNSFEKRNKFEWLAHSFRENKITADLCFEFSSEGEYQQVAPLIDDAIRAGKKIELVFFSPSVERTIMKLAAHYPDQIRYLRYPMVRILPFVERRCFSHWVTAKTLIMVRYDLFPEFLLWSMKKGNTLKIIWMTFKKERSAGKKPSAWKLMFLKYARAIVYAGTPDFEDGMKLQLPGEVFDFRMEQIKRRVEKKNEKFASHFSLYSSFRQELEGKKKLILGNAWPSDLPLLRDLPKDVVLVIVPHQLSAEILKAFRDGLKGRDVFEVNDQTTEWKNSSTILINKKGILCELYADFPHAYVGGGFEGSIHSVLEPFVAGSEKIACGPQHHRSTEYDIAYSEGRISEVNTPEQFLEWLNSGEKKSVHAKLKTQNYESMREFVISC
jgi:3-deoxy-D-manno-octulosonic-acid transferase